MMMFRQMLKCPGWIDQRGGNGGVQTVLEETNELGRNEWYDVAVKEWNGRQKEKKRMEEMRNTKSAGQKADQEMGDADYTTGWWTTHRTFQDYWHLVGGPIVFFWVRASICPFFFSFLTIFALFFFSISMGLDWKIHGCFFSLSFFFTIGVQCIQGIVCMEWRENWFWPLRLPA